MAGDATDRARADVDAAAGLALPSTDAASLTSTDVDAAAAVAWRAAAAAPAG